MSEWDASQIKQPGWHHVEAAFIEGAREARANPEADEAMFRRAADGYTKRVFEEVDPVSEAALRTGCWGAGNAGLLRAMCDEKGMACDCGIPDELWERAQTEAVGINGLTEAETTATASVMGLVGAQRKPTGEETVQKARRAAKAMLSVGPQRNVR